MTCETTDMLIDYLTIQHESSAPGFFLSFGCRGWQSSSASGSVDHSATPKRRHGVGVSAIVPAKETLTKPRSASWQRKLFCEPLSALLWKARSESLQLFTVLPDQGLKPCKTNGIGRLQVRKSGAKKF
jgi:hypothetical protein